MKRQLLVIFVLFCVQSLYAAEPWQVRIDDVKVYSSPQADTIVDGMAYSYGDTITAVDYDSNFVEIALEGGAKGYVSKEYLIEATNGFSKMTVEEKVASKIYKPTSATIVYSRPEDGSERVPLTLTRHPYIYDVQPVNDQWMSIPIGGGRLGYIKSMYVNEASHEEKLLLFDPGRFNIPLKSRTTVYRSPSEKAEVIDKLPAGTEVLVVAHDPDAKWARVLLGNDPETQTVGYVDKKRLDLSGGRELTVTNTFTSSDYWSDTTWKASAERRPWNAAEKVIYYISIGLILIFPIVYRIFRRKFEGREHTFALLTVAAAIAFLIYDYVIFNVLNVKGGIEIGGLFDFKDLLFKLLAFLAFVGSIYCAIPLLVWAWLRIKPLYDKKAVRIVFSKFPQAIVPLLFVATMICVASQALSLFIYLVLSVAIMILLVILAFRVVTGQVIGWGRRGGGGSSGVRGTCSTCRYYMHSSCTQSGTPTGPGSSCGSYSPS